MKTPLYREALAHSWNLAWKHKILLVFGLFAALLGQMGLLELLTKIGFASSDYGLYPQWLAIPKLINYLSPDLSGLSLTWVGWIWLVWLLLIVIGMIAFFVFMAISSQGLLIHISAKSIRQKNLPEIKESWHAGVIHLWRLFFLNLFKKVVMILLAVAVGYGTWNFVSGYSGSSLFLFLLIFLLVVLVGMVVSFLTVYAASYVVVEGRRFWPAIEQAWKMFLNHWLVSIEVGLIILLLDLLLSVVAILGFFILLFPTLILWFLASLTTNFVLYLVGLVIGVLVFLFFIIFLGSLFTVFSTSVWTFLFMKMHKEGMKSHVLHWWGHYKK